jgi:hypothetical protein
MTSIALNSNAFLYVSSDVPAGQSLGSWRRERDDARRVLRRRFSWLPNLRLRP